MMKTKLDCAESRRSSIDLVDAEFEARCDSCSIDSTAAAAFEVVVGSIRCR